MLRGEPEPDYAGCCLPKEGFWIFILSSLEITEGTQKKAVCGHHEGGWGGPQGIHVLLMSRKLRK